MISLNKILVLLFFLIFLSLNVFGSSNIFIPNEDGYIDSNFFLNTGDYLKVDQLSIFGPTYRSFMEFDISSINGTIHEVYLNLTRGTNAGAGGLEIVFLPNALSDSGTTEDVYNSIESSTTKVSKTYPLDVNTPFLYDISSFNTDIQTALDANGIFMIGLRDSAESSGFEVYFFDSSAINPAHRPTLKIVYTPTEASTPDNPPAINLSKPLNDTTITEDMVSFTGNASDDHLIESCSLYTNFTGAWTINETKTVNNNFVEFDFSLDLSNLANGNYIWNVQCTDNASLSAFAPSNFTFTLNLPKAVTVTALTPTNNTLVKAGTPVSLEYTKTSDLTISNCYLYINDTLNETSTLNFTQTFTPGIYEWFIKCEDTASNQNQTKTYTLRVGDITIQTTHPTHPTANMNVNRNQTFQYNVTITCQGFCGNTTASLDPIPEEKTLSLWQKILNFFRRITGFATKGFLINTTIGAEPFYTTDNNPILHTDNACLQNMNGNSCEISWNVIPTGEVNTYTFFAFVNETNDILNHQTTNVNITIQNTPPTITLTSPNNNQELNTGTISFPADVQDDYNIENCSIYTNTTGIYQKNETLTVNQKSKSIIFSIHIPQPGEYNWTIECTDNDLATTKSETRILTIQTPTSPTGGGGGGGGGSYTPPPPTPPPVILPPSVITVEPEPEKESEPDTEPEKEEKSEERERYSPPPEKENPFQIICKEEVLVCEEFFIDLEKLMKDTLKKIELIKEVTYNETTNETQVKMIFSAEDDLENLNFYQSIPKCMAYYVHLIKFKNTDFEIIKVDPLIVWHFDTISRGEVIDLSFEVMGKIPPECYELLSELIYENHEKYSPSYRSGMAIFVIIVAISLVLIGISKVDTKIFKRSHKEKIKDIDTQLNKMFQDFK